MKLLLTWLLGVPLLVGSMVLAREALAPERRESLQRTEVVARQCLRQEQFDRVPPSISEQRHRLACDRRAIQ